MTSRFVRVDVTEFPQIVRDRCKELVGEGIPRSFVTSAAAYLLARGETPRKDAIRVEAKRNQTQVETATRKHMEANRKATAA